MRTKGFSLVELSIVLMVIGIILVFVVRASNLTITAREFRDLSMVSKLRNAFTTINGRTHRYPDMATAGLNHYYDMNYFYENGFFTEKELESQIVDGASWALVVCSDQSTTPEGVDEYYNIENIRNNYVCAVTAKNKVISLNDRLICLIERDLDNKNLVTGYGRSTVGGDNTTYDFDDCRSHPITERAPDSKKYLYRIF